MRGFKWLVVMKEESCKGPVRIQLGTGVERTGHTRRAPASSQQRWPPVGKGGGGINWEIGIDMYTLLYIK